MNIQNELRTLGFVHAGAIRSDDSGRSCYADLSGDVEGCVVYALVVGDQIVKFGKAGSKNSTLKMRMRATASALNGAIRLADGRPLNDAGWHHRPLDPFKRHAPAVIRANQNIEVWAKESTASTCADEELELNLNHKPAWSNSTDSTDPTTLSLRLKPEERQIIDEAAGKKGWKAAHFLRVSALERAAQVLNLSRASSFDFSGAAKRFAEVLVAPRTVTIGSPVGLGAHESLVDLPEDTTLADVVEDRDLDLENLSLQDFRPRPLTPEQVEELQKAMRLGGAEFAEELIVECRRLGKVASEPHLPPPIDPHNLRD